MGHNLVLCFIFDDFGFLQEQYGHSVVFGGFTWCRSFGGYCTSSSSSGVSSDPYSHCGFCTSSCTFISRGTKTRPTVPSCPLQHPRAKKLAAKAHKAKMTDFDRFKLAQARTRRSKEVKKSLKKK